MNVFVAKLTAALTLGTGSLIAGLIPLCIVRRQRQRSPLFLSSLLCFGGGVLLATALVHILPEFRKSIPQFHQYAEVIFAAGFFLLYVIDEIVHFYYEGGEHGGVIASNKHEEPSTSTYGATASERQPIIHSTERQSTYNPFVHNHHQHCNHSANSHSYFVDDEQPPSQICHVANEEPCKTVGPAVTLGLLIALSVHALLEGLVVGLQNVPTKVLLMLGAVASHKLVVAFCLGMELSSNPANSACKTIVDIVVFTSGTVGGILIGMMISAEKATGATIPILQGIAGGTLLYVTVSEVIPRERARWHQEHQYKFAGVVQFLSVVVGFILMTSLTLFLDVD